MPAPKHPDVSPFRRLVHQSALAVLGLAVGSSCGGRSPLLVADNGSAEGGTPAVGGQLARGGAPGGGGFSFGGAYGTGGTYAVGGSTAAGGWGAASGMMGAFRSEFAPKGAPPVDRHGSPLPSSPGTSVAIRVHSGTVLRQVPRTLTGVNAATWDGDEYLLTETLKRRLRAVSTPLLRFPGGSTSDNYHWDGVYPPYVSADNGRCGTSPCSVFGESWAVDTAEFLTLARELGAIPLITVNYGYATYDTTASDGTLANATALAADWVEYANSPNDGRNPNGGTDWAARRAADGSPEPFGVKYWEIGNEIYGSWETGYQSNGAVYGADVVKFVAAMKAVDPTIYVGAVADVDFSAPQWTNSLLSTPGVAGSIDFLDAHEYFYFGSGMSPAAILPLARQVQEDMRMLRTALNGRARPDLPILFGEFGCTLDSTHESTALSGLFITKVLGEAIRTGYDAATQWDIANGWGSSGGDHGFLSAGSTVVPDYTPRPSYYAHYFFTQTFGDRLLESSCSDPDVAVYASEFSGGETGLVMLNETGAPLTANVALDRPAQSGEINGWVLAATSLSSMSVTFNGQSNGLPEGGPALDGIVPYYWQVGVTSTFTLDLPPYSVTGLVVY